MQAWTRPYQNGANWAGRPTQRRWRRRTGTDCPTRPPRAYRTQPRRQWPFPQRHHRHHHLLRAWPLQTSIWVFPSTRPDCWDRPTCTILWRHSSIPCTVCTTANTICSRRLAVATVQFLPPPWNPPSRPSPSSHRSKDRSGEDRSGEDRSTAAATAPLRKRANRLSARWRRLRRRRKRPSPRPRTVRARAPVLPRPSPPAPPPLRRFPSPAKTKPFGDLIE